VLLAILELPFGITQVILTPKEWPIEPGIVFTKKERAPGKLLELSR
jgi:hypothetical protein